MKTITKTRSTKLGVISSIISVMFAVAVSPALALTTMELVVSAPTAKAPHTTRARASDAAMSLFPNISVTPLVQFTIQRILIGLVIIVH